MQVSHTGTSGESCSQFEYAARDSKEGKYAEALMRILIGYAAIFQQTLQPNPAICRLIRRSDFLSIKTIRAESFLFP